MAQAERWPAGWESGSVTGGRGDSGLLRPSIHICLRVWDRATQVAPRHILSNGRGYAQMIYHLLKQCLLIGNLWTAPLCATESFPGGRNGLVRVLRDQIFCDFMLSTSDTCPSIGHAASEVPLHILTFDGFLDQFFNIHPIFHVCRWLSAPREGFTLLHQFVLLQQQCLNPFPPDGLTGLFGALLVGWLVVVVRGLYLARHLFTLYSI